MEGGNPGRGQKGTRTSRRGLGHHVAKVWPLVVFCWREGIGPHDVNDRVVQRFLVDLEAQKGKRAFAKAPAAIYASQEERRAGKECVSTCRTRCSPFL